MKPGAIGFLVLALLTLPSLGKAAQSETPAQAATDEASETQSIAKAIVRCRNSPDTPGCGPIMQIMNAVAQVNSAPRQGAAQKNDAVKAVPAAASGIPIAAVAQAATVTPAITSSPAGAVATTQGDSSQSSVIKPVYPKCSPPGLGAQPSAKSNFGFQATSDTKNATLSWQVPFSNCVHKTQSLKVSAQSPIDQSADFQNVATLDGLAKSTSIGLDYAVFNTAKSPWTTLSVNGKFGAEQHTFYSSAGLTKSTKTKYPYQLGVSYAWLLDKNDTANQRITLSYNYQQAYKDGGKVGQTQILCPASTTAPIKCVSGYINAPTNIKKHLVTAEYAYISESNFTGTPLAVVPAFTYDAGSHHYGIELPLYIMPNSSKYLTGGIRYDWNSDKHESIVGIFVTSPLCLAPGATVCSKSSSAGS